MGTGYDCEDVGEDCPDAQAKKQPVPIFRSDADAG
jgi:hypothetical protein